MYSNFGFLHIILPYVYKYSKSKHFSNSTSDLANIHKFLASYPQELLSIPTGHFLQTEIQYSIIMVSLLYQFEQKSLLKNACSIIISKCYANSLWMANIPSIVNIIWYQNNHITFHSDNMFCFPLSLIQWFGLAWEIKGWTCSQVKKLIQTKPM